MAENLPDLKARIKLDTSALNGSLASARTSVSSFGTHATKVASIIGGAFAGIQIGGFLKGAISEARDAEAAARQTEAVLKSTGGVAKVTSKDIDQLTKSLQKKNVVDDDTIRKGSNLLLTFTNVRNEVGKGNDIFNRANQAALDLSATFKQDISASSVQLGKALNDPIKGVTALQRVGVSFTQQQKDQIKTMVESGDILGAQKIILGELETQTRGAAAAQADSAKRLGVAFGNLKESIGKALLPVIDKLVEALPKIGAALRPIADALAPVIKRFFEIVKANPAPFFAALAVVIASALVPAVVALVSSLAVLLSPVVLITAAVAAVAAGVVYAYQNFETFRGIVDGVARFLRDDFLPAVQTVFGIITTVVKTFIAILKGDWSAAWEGVKQIVRGAIDTIIGWLLAPFKFIVDLGPIQAAIDKAKELIEKLEKAASFLGGAGGGTFEKLLAEQNAKLAKQIVTGAVRREHGGPVSAGMPYLVGERGPELVVPSRNGTVLTADQTTAGLGNSITINARTNANPADIGRELAWILRTAV